MEKIIIFGKGYYLSKKIEYLKDNYNIIAFLDNSRDNINNIEIEGNVIPTYLPRDFGLLPNEKIILMSITHFVDMYYQLLGEGVDEERIDFGMNYLPFYDCTEELLSKIHGRVLGKNKKLSVICDKGEYVFSTAYEYKRIMAKLTEDMLCFNIMKDFPTVPFSRRFGRERGTPIDRYYIDKFISANSPKICGDVMEIGDNFYTKQYGGADVNNSYVLHNLGLGENVIRGDLASEEGVGSEFLDCFICTQTLQMIYDFEMVVRNMHNAMKKDGVVLATIHGISHLSMSDYERWGEYWRFTKQSATRLFEKFFDEVYIETYGNVKTVTAHLYGLCQEDLTEEDYCYNDEQYPLVVCIVAKK